MFEPDGKKAEPGDIIEFKQDGALVRGKVLPSKTTNSIIVDISAAANYEALNHGYHNTVVNHNNYRIVDESNHQNLNTGEPGSVFG